MVKIKNKKQIKKEQVSEVDFKLKFAKENLEHKKTVYETYLRACIKYEPATIAYSAIMAEDLYHNELMRLMEKARNKDKTLMNMMFGERNTKELSEIERIQGEEEYYDRLIKLVENRISMMSADIKMKMAKDAIEKMNAWLGLSKYEQELSKTKNLKNEITSKQ